MCGLTTIYSYQGPAVDQDELLRTRDYMLLRGPDGAGAWISEDGKVGLGHRRLSIIDLTEHGAQPMATADGKLRIIFNGEIYNYRELRERLRAKGHSFRSDSDTEVLLYAWREYGQGMVDHLRGMFAFAIWDQDKRGLFLARDHFGIKPLYYHDDGRTFRAASQVKALLAGGAVPIQPEPAGHVGFYVWGCVPEPHTLYRNLFALPAGHTLWVDGTGSRVPSKHFDVADELERASAGRIEQPASEVLKGALRDSVKHHLIADVTVGVFLSSGLDSATLMALAAEELSSLHAITLGFSEYENTMADEVPLARKVAAQYGCTHHIGRITRGDFQHNLPAILHGMDQPSIDGVNTWFVAREAKRAGFKVALSGLGGDELLGGYPSFRQIPRVASRLGLPSRFPAIGKALRQVSAPILRRYTSPKYASLLEYGGSYGGAYLLRRGLFMPWELPRFLDRDFVREGWDTLQPLLHLNERLRGRTTPHAKVAALEMSCYMRNMLLRDSDWAGMAHSLEIRVPFVDITLFRLLAPYLASDKPPQKKDLIGVPQRTLPREVTSRPKTGFSVPVREWIAGQGLVAGERGLRGWALVAIRGNREAGATGRRKRVLVFRIGSLGDTCIAIPAFRLIRSAYPLSEISVLTNFPMDGGVKDAPLEAVIGKSALVDGYIEYPVGLRSLRELSRCVRSLRAWGPDTLVYLMPLRTRFQLLRDLFFFKVIVRVPEIVGFSFDRGAQAHHWDEMRQAFEGEAHRLVRNLAALGEVDLSSKESWDLGLRPEEIEKSERILATWKGAGRYIACSIGAKWSSKDWGQDRWEELIGSLSEELEDFGLLLVGAPIESGHAEKVARLWRGPALNLCGLLKPRETAEVIRRARCYIGHDSGPMHLAAAVGTPCVSVFSAQDKPGIWFPFGDRHRIIYHKTECFGCKLKVCKIHEKKCIRSITAPEVAEALRSVLAPGRNEIALNVAKLA